MRGCGLIGRDRSGQRAPERLFVGRKPPPHEMPAPGQGRARRAADPIGNSTSALPRADMPPAIDRARAPAPQKLSKRLAPLDRAAGILRDPHAIGFRAVEREQHRRAQRHIARVCGHRAFRGHRDAQRTDRPGPGQFAEKDEALILVHDRRALHRVGAQILHDVLHRPGLDQPAILHHLADADIIPAILPVIADPHDAAIGQVQAPAALHLKEEKLDRIGSPCQFQPAPGQRARHDLRPFVKGNELAAGHLAANGPPFQAVAELAEIDVDQVGGTAIDRHLITRLARARPVDFRFIIACDERCAVADLHRFEIAGEKFAGGAFRPAGSRRAGIVPVRASRQSALVGAAHQRGAG